MKQGIFFRLDPEQVEHIKQQKNQSEYINDLVKADQHRETRYEYVWPIVRKYTMDNIQPKMELELISDLTMKLARSIIGEDILTEIMEGGQK